MSNVPGNIATGRARPNGVIPELDPERVARGLGWFSIGLGVVELFGPRTLTWTFGAKYQEPLYQLAGLREVVSGVGVLLSRDKSQWLWARVAGDAMDVFMLGLGHGRRRKGATLMALLSVLGVTALDVWSAQRLQEQSDRRSRSVRPADSNAPATSGW